MAGSAKRLRYTGPQHRLGCAAQGNHRIHGQSIRRRSESDRRNVLLPVRQMADAAREGLVGWQIGRQQAGIGGGPLQQIKYHLRVHGNGGTLGGLIIMATEAALLVGGNTR